MEYTRFAFAIVLTIIVINIKAQNQKPNIILILADDIGYKSLTCYGGNLNSTPNIDKLAKQGMRFTRCNSSPLCSPSRFMLLTGKYNFRNYSDWGAMDLNQKTIGNMMKDVGYKTGCYGKWQLGSRQSINIFGFDNYCVYLDSTHDFLNYSRYKSPHIVSNGKYLADSKTLNKYGEDIFTDSVLNFIESHQSTPFFVYYPMVLGHEPFCPTPDDPAFLDWNSNPDNSDTAFHTSMIKYMDKKIGQIMNKIKSLGIEDKTIVIFAGDNGTPRTIFDYTGNDGNLIKGGKGTTTAAGTRVPLIVTWRNTIVPGTVNKDLIDFTDFLPTVAGIANIPVPTDYGPLDGVSFYPRLTNQPGTPRDWIFCHYDRTGPNGAPLVRWAQTVSYKLYDTSSLKKVRLFYNIVKDSREKNPISDSLLTANEKKVKQQLLDVINNYVAQGIPIISSNPSILFINDSSLKLKDTIKANGGSTVTASGAVWGTKPNPKISSSNHTSTETLQGPFSTIITGLTPNTTYYIRAYATNFAGTVYSNQVKFTTLDVPVATKATGIDSNKFIANWKAYAGATNYRLDVSTSPTFTRITTPTITEGFDSGIIAPEGWTISSNIKAATSVFGVSAPALKFTASKQRITTALLSGPAIQLKFWIKGMGTDDTSSLLVEGFDGNSWKVIANLTKLARKGVIKTFNASSNPQLSQDFIQFRFTYTRNAGALIFDDVSIKYNKPVPLFVPGYRNLLVQTNSKIVTGLQAGTNYYYRVRAVKEGITTDNSNVIGVITKKAASIIATAKLYAAEIVTNSDTVNLAKRQFAVQVFPNPSPGEFMLTLQTGNKENVNITVTDTRGKILYRSSGNGNCTFTFGKTFAPGEYFISVTCGKLNRYIKVIKMR
ncbi:MAG TPA: sulfatase-like hydrolase/transferase [Parafilimonas sp.]|nr:sulfatase-like hydrolase/transferase [Parafilimonas sp.]